jgi:hypothetical protein
MPCSPACPSSPINLLAAHTGPAPEGVDQPDAASDTAVAVDLLAALAAVPDPRARRAVSLWVCQAAAAVESGSDPDSLVRETPRNAGDMGDARRSAHNPATIISRR